MEYYKASVVRVAGRIWFRKQLLVAYRRFTGSALNPTANNPLDHRS